MNQNLVKRMDKDFVDKLIGITCGYFGGMISFVQTAWIDTSFWMSLVKAGITAIVCGMGGLAGKNMFLSAQKKWKRYKRSRRKY